MSGTAAALPYVDAAALTRTLSWADASAALEGALLGGLDPAAAADRAVVDVASGQLLLMPAETATGVGVKLATVAPRNPERALPRIQALYVVVDHATLTPRALIDGTALTTLRTPAVSAVAVKYLAAADARRLVVFGSGPQAWGHVQALRAVRPVETVMVVGRDRSRAESLVAKVAGTGLSAAVGDQDCVAAADIVVCATTAPTALFDSRLLKPGVCVVAVGSHDRDRRELDGATLRCAAAGAGVVVEDRDVAMREAGDVILAVAEGAITVDQLVDLASVVRRKEPPPPGMSVFKSVGMGWQDLVVAEAVLDRLAGDVHP